MTENAGIGKTKAAAKFLQDNPIHHGIPEGGPQHWDVKKPVEDDREGVETAGEPADGRFVLCNPGQAEESG